MNKLYLLLASLSLTCAPLQGATPMNDAKMLDILVSQKGMTRLSVVGDQIVDVHVFPAFAGTTDMSSLVQLQDSGHVLLYLKDFKRPFQLTLMTRRGRVQDLTLIPSSRPTEPILLSPALTLQEQEQQHMKHRKPYEEKMKALLSGIIPQGIQRIRSSSSLKTWGSLKGMILASYEDKNAFYEVYFIENTNSQPITLQPSLFLFGNVEAVVFEQTFLAPQSKTQMVLLKARKGSLFSQPYERNSL